MCDFLIIDQANFKIKYIYDNIFDWSNQLLTNILSGFRNVLFYNEGGNGGVLCKMVLS